MPKLILTYKNYIKNDLDSYMEKFVGKLIAKKGFGKNGSRVLEFNFLSLKASKAIASKLRQLSQVVEKVTVIDD